MGRTADFWKKNTPFQLNQYHDTQMHNWDNVMNYILLIALNYNHNPFAWDYYPLETPETIKAWLINKNITPEKKEKIL